MVIKAQDSHDIAGTTAQKPTNLEPGELYFDTTIGALCVSPAAGGTPLPVVGMTGLAAAAAAGTNQSTATALTAGPLTIVTAADGAKGVKLPATNKGGCVVYNSSSSPLFVYPDSGSTINGGSTNAAVFIKPLSVAHFFYNSATAWSAIFSSQNEERVQGASTAAAGSNTSDAGVLPAGTAEVYLASAADGTKGVRIHASDDVAGRHLRIANNVSNQILKVYPPFGGTINGAAANAAFSTVSGKGALLWCRAAGEWYAW